MSRVKLIKASFVVDEVHRQAVFCGLDLAFIVFLKSSFQISTISRVELTIFFRKEYVYVKHDLKGFNRVVIIFALLR